MPTMNLNRYAALTALRDTIYVFKVQRLNSFTIIPCIKDVLTGEIFDTEVVRVKRSTPVSEDICLLSQVMFPSKRDLTVF